MTRTLRSKARRSGKLVVPKAFVTYLKYHRLRLGLTQEQVAIRAKIGQGTYSDYERGLKHPRPSIHVRLARVLQRPIDEFTGKLYGVNGAEMVGTSASK